eukprot:COSAG05_NODE_334_length_11233_cov_697.826477_7_plen_112_part_00
MWGCNDPRVSRNRDESGVDQADAAAARSVSDLARITSLQRDLSSTRAVHRVQLADVTARLSRRDKELEALRSRFEHEVREADRLREQIRHAQYTSLKQQQVPSTPYRKQTK